MRIYKYVDARALDLILESQRIVFTHPADFNDPFDRPRVSRTACGFEYHDIFSGELMTPEMQAASADKAWGECAVSSFTRTHDNALMWAHYADKHKGAVIEIDAEAAGLMSKSFLIPVQFGSVIYMKRPNPAPGPARGLAAIRAQMIESGEGRFEIDNYEGLQRLFLTKGLSWAYEEEARVVCEAFRFGLSCPLLSGPPTIIVWPRKEMVSTAVGFQATGAERKQASDGERHDMKMAPIGAIFISLSNSWVRA